MMELKGSLAELVSSDLLRLIGDQAKTGVLHLISKEEEVRLAFLDGNVVWADPLSRVEEDPLARRLINSNLLQPRQLAEALVVQRRTLQRLGDILVESGYLSQDQLRASQQLEALEVVHRIVRWNSGTYEFDHGALNHETLLTAPIRTDAVLLEANHRRETLPAIRKVIPSPSTTFLRLVLQPPEATGGSAGSDSMEKLDQDNIESLVLQVADPGRTVREIADRLGLELFDAERVLYNLVSSGKLRPIPAGYSEGGGRRSGQRKRSPTEHLPGVVARIGMTATVATLLLGLAHLLDLQRAAKLVEVAVVSDQTARHVIAQTEIGRLTMALSVFRMERGNFPAELGELHEAGLLSEGDLRYPFRTPYYYERRLEGGFLLLPPIE